MNNKVLIAYATTAGATEEIAEEIGEVLRQKGVSVDVRMAQEVRDLSAYGAVVIGSPIYMGRPLKEFAKFVEQHQSALQQVPVHAFVVSGLIKEGKPETRETINQALAPLYQLVSPRSAEIFAGRMAFKPLSFLHRTIAKAMKAEEGDWRDWDAIRAWAASLPATFPAA